MRYKVGEKVRVKYYKDLVKDNELKENGDIVFDHCIFMREMKVYCGEIYSVKSVFGKEYELALKDGGEWFFDEKMLEKVVDQNENSEDSCNHEDCSKNKSQYRKKVE